MSSDDRPEYASLQAVLFGPFLLAGLTTGDWDAKTGGAAAAVSDWITPIPPSSNSQLVTLAQESGAKAFILSTVNGSLTMQDRPEGGGTDAAVHATLRFIPQGSGAAMNSTSAMLEPFATPGMVITDKLTVAAEKSSGALFNVVPGLDGAPGTVSLELGARPGCFLVAPAGGNGYSAGAKVQVGCGSGARKHGDGGAVFRRAASFVRAEPLRRYHPISFSARGLRRSFLLEPLFTLRDEFYTIFFNLGA
uniref:Uncharacterized protein n=1 Tax=Arundo donax TaxID=35708 RepID=A0A0A9DHX4_ARUDO